MKSISKRLWDSWQKLRKNLVTAEIECDKKHLFIQVLFFVMIFSACFFLFLNHAKEKFISSDLPLHIHFTSQYFSGKMIIPHPGIHTICYYFSTITGLSLQYSFVVVLSLFVTLIALIVYFILLKFLKEYYSPGFLLFITFLLMLVSSIYVPFFNRNVYLLQGSPNVWHNPTAIGVKPLAFLSLILLILFYTKDKYQENIKFYFLTASALFLSTWIKPNFILSFLPAAAIFLLIKYTKRWDLYLKTLVVILPVMVYLINQYISYSNTGTGGIIIDFLGVWKHYSRNPFISIFLGTAFPLLLILSRFRKVMKNPYFLISSLNLLIAILQLMFFAESGGRYTHANFGWGYMIALQLMFVFAAVEYFKWMTDKKTHLYELIKFFMVTIAFGLHLSSGIFYTLKIWSGYSYG